MVPPHSRTGICRPPPPPGARRPRRAVRRRGARQAHAQVGLQAAGDALPGRAGSSTPAKRRPSTRWARGARRRSKAVGIYVGGAANRACGNAGLAKDWVRQVHAQGWSSCRSTSAPRHPARRRRKPSHRPSPGRGTWAGRMPTTRSTAPPRWGRDRAARCTSSMEGATTDNADRRRDVLNLVVRVDYPAARARRMSPATTAASIRASTTS
ncbi:hypothetical protein ACU686_23330 [Yinghuangia aomiensis]